MKSVLGTLVIVCCLQAFQALPWKRHTGVEFPHAETLCLWACGQCFFNEMDAESSLLMECANDACINHKAHSPLWRKACPLLTKIPGLKVAPV